MNEKIILIGAGSAGFARGLVSDIIRHGWGGEIGLVDIDPVALEVAEKMTRKMLDQKGSTLKLSASTDRRDVLTDATTVVSTIGVGGRDAWAQDVLIPRKYDIYHPVGDSVMPGNRVHGVILSLVMARVHAGYRLVLLLRQLVPRDPEWSRYSHRVRRKGEVAFIVRAHSEGSLTDIDKFKAQFRHSPWSSPHGNSGCVSLDRAAG